MPNTIKDLLRDLAVEAGDQTLELKNAEIVKLQERKDPDFEAVTKMQEKLTDEYHDRFIKEISKYFGLEEK